MKTQFAGTRITTNPQPRGKAFIRATRIQGWVGSGGCPVPRRLSKGTLDTGKCSHNPIRLGSFCVGKSFVPMRRIKPKLPETSPENVDLSRNDSKCSVNSD